MYEWNKQQEQQKKQTLNISLLNEFDQLLNEFFCSSFLPEQGVKSNFAE